MKRTDNIIPGFGRLVSRPSQVIKHDYPFSEVNTDPSTEKHRILAKRSPQPPALSQIRGREDNLMYRVSDGYNLEKNDKTYFDKHNVMELINASRSLNSSFAVDSKTDYQGSNNVRRK